jgi:hypothetical protein
MTFREKMWLWGHNAGSHDKCKIPRPSIATPLEGAVYLGIPNMCRVVFGGKPQPPFDQDALLLDPLDKVVWSIVGDSSSVRNDHGWTDAEAVGRAAQDHPNIIGGILDDFLNPARIGQYSPDYLRQCKQTMRQHAGRDMQLWTVIYTQELTDAAIPYLDVCDVATLWTWSPENLVHLDENWQRLRALFPDKPILGGCYLWNYADQCAMPQDLLEYQLDIYNQWLRKGKLEGVIFCSNNVIDVGLESVATVKSWIHKHGHDVLDT